MVYIVIIFNYRYRILPRVLRGVSIVSTATTLLGNQKVAIPVGISPSARQVYAHKDAEIATAAGE